MDAERIGGTVKSAVLAAIPDEWHIKANEDAANVAELVNGTLTLEERSIVGMDATGLRDALADRQYTAVQVIQAFGKASAIVHQRTNCINDYFLEEAMIQARWLDDELQRTGRVVGPLHGVPISVKDSIAVKGHRDFAGFACWAEDLPSAADAPLIARLREAGAVFWVITNTAQAIMQLETDNFLDQTVNPFNQNLTAGGSSGGEGALIGGHGSVKGIGTDIGGSIRVPAAHCGIYGLKTTMLRLPRMGGRRPMAGQEGIMGCIGPLARSARDLDLFMSTMLDMTALVDDTFAPLPWQPDTVTWIGGRLPRVGVMWNDGVVEPLEPMRRALSSAVDALRLAGFDVVDYKAYGTSEAWSIISALYFTEGGERLRHLAEQGGETLRPLTQWIVDQSNGAKSPSEIIELVRAREGFRTRYLRHFRDANVDIILCPPFPGPAPRCGTSNYWSYTSIFNLLDYPAASMPTCEFVGEHEVQVDREGFLSQMDESLYRDHPVTESAGAPLSLQVVAARWQDEKAVKATRLFAEVFASRRKSP